VSRSADGLRILHIALTLDETCPTYNEHCVPMAHTRRISICTYFAPALSPHPNGTAKGFLAAIDEALSTDDYDVVHAHAPHFGPLLIAAHLRYRGRLRPLVFTVHNSYPNFKARNKALLTSVFASASSVVCCSRSSKASFPTLFHRLAGKRLTSVANGVDVARVQRILDEAPPEVAKTNAAPFRVISVGRIVEIKAPLTLLASFVRSFEGALSDPMQLLFIGEGDLHGDLDAARLETSAAEDVQLVGLMSRDEVYRSLAKADLFVSTSTGEGLPIATLEAMACGCPVVLSDIEPHREIASGASFIPLVPTGDEAGFAAEIDRFRAMPAEQRAEIGALCRSHVEQNFSLEAMHQGYGDLYRALIDCTVAQVTSSERYRGRP
jgi:glycosyltransferase involved in cell wall biosynthesis